MAFRASSSLLQIFLRVLLGLVLVVSFSRAEDYVVSTTCPNKPFELINSCHLHPKDHAPGQSPGRWGPWGWEPACFIPERTRGELFCLVSSPDFNNGKGMSVIGTQHTIGSILKDALFNETVAALAKKHLDLETDDRGNKEELSYELVALSDKDLGLIARRNIKRGESFISSLPAVVIDHELLHLLDEEPLAYALVDRVLDQLVDRSRVLNLAQTMGGEILLDVMSTNAHDGVIGGRKVTALYPEIARMNHNCDPNTIVRFSPSTLQMQGLAVRDITKGEEIELSYLPDGLTSEERKSKLKDSFGFDCICALCTAPDEEIAKSDANRRRIDEIWRTIGDNPDMSHEEMFQLTNEMMRLADTEHLGPGRMKRQLHDLMKLYFEYGDVSSANIFAQAALELSETFDGEDDLEGLQPVLRQNMKRLQEHYEALLQSMADSVAGDGEDVDEEEDEQNHDHSHADHEHHHGHHSHDDADAHGQHGHLHLHKL